MAERVFLVMGCESVWGRSGVLGIYSSRAKAEESICLGSGHMLCSIQELPIDPPFREFKNSALARMRRNHGDEAAARYAKNVVKLAEKFAAQEPSEA